MISHLPANYILQTYETLRPLLPQANFPKIYQRTHTLADLQDRYDAFFFDAFGVLNLGEKAIDFAAQRITSLRQAGKQVCVVSNAASVTRQALQQKYTRLGFDFTQQEIVSSRDALLDHLTHFPVNFYGVTAPIDTDLSDFSGEFINLVQYPEKMDEVKGFILLSSQSWTNALQEQLIASLQRHPRPLLLGNPDLVAPRDEGFSLEPGFLAKMIHDKTGIHALAFGKPYPSIFELAKNKLPPNQDLNRVLMIGDTLHTDVLGACHAGLHSAMVCQHGFASCIDWEKAIQDTGICPHHVVDFI